MSLPNLDLIFTTTSHHTSLARAAVTEWRKKNDQTTATKEKMADVPHNEMVKYNGLHYEVRGNSLERKGRGIVIYISGWHTQRVSIE
jgi:hypothetical protein